MVDPFGVEENPETNHLRSTSFDSDSRVAWVPPSAVRLASPPLDSPGLGQLNDDLRSAVVGSAERRHFLGLLAGLLKRDILQPFETWLFQHQNKVGNHHLQGNVQV